MRDVVTTCVLHHPMRPVKCLLRALHSLDSATTREHHVEVIVQGALMEGAQLPDPKLFEHIRLVYHHNEKNLGNAVPLIHSKERFLKTGHQWWAKFDDDMSFPGGSWDLAIEALKNEDRLGEYNCGCAMIAVPSSMWSGVPRNFWHENREGKVPLLRWDLKGYVVRDDGTPPRYTVCDFADHGCTVFKREVLEAGCAPDERLFTGGCDFDVCFQMLEKGFKSIHVFDPRSAHHHGECKPYNYGVIRYDPAQTRRAGNLLMEKWGVEIELLTNFSGLSAYAPPKRKRES